MASITIDAPAAKVWEAIINPALRKRWFFGVDTRTDWREGSPIVHAGEWNGKPYKDKGVVKEVLPEKKLVHTHWSSMSGRPDKPENYETINYKLTELNGTTEVGITEENVANEKQKAASDKMWSGALRELKKVVEHDGAERLPE